MHEHAHSLAGAPPPAVRTLSCPPKGTVTLAIDPAAPLIESVEAHLHAEDALRARLSGSTLRLELSARVPDPVALRSLGRVLREVHDCTLIAVDCDEEALRRFAEQQLHLVVHLAEPRLTAPPAVVPPPLPASVAVVEVDAVEGDAVEGDEAVDGKEPIRKQDAAANEGASSELPDFDDFEDDPDADWGDEDLAQDDQTAASEPDDPAVDAAAVDAAAVDTAAVDDAPVDVAAVSTSEPAKGPPTQDDAELDAPVETSAPEPAVDADCAQVPLADETSDPGGATEPLAASTTADPADAPTDPGLSAPSVDSSDSAVAASTPPALPEAPSAAPPDELESEARPLPQGWNPEGRGRVTAVRRTLRSGNRVRAAGDLVVYGDVNAGAQVEATGNVIVLGALRGLAHAGVNGETEAVVLALELDRGQVRIADQISFEAGAPAGAASRQGRLRLLLGRGSSPAAPRSGPTLLRLEGDHIVTEPWRGRLPDLSAR